MKRFYCENLVDGDLHAQLSPIEARHAISVMRLKAGQEIELVDGKGGLASGIIDFISKKTVSIKITDLTRAEEKKQGKVVIVTSLAKGDRFDWLISKCTELGADRIIPVIYERTVKLAKGSKAHQRWQNIAISAMKQCERLFLPTIDEPVSLDQAINKLKADYPACKIIVGSLSDEAVAVCRANTDCKDDIAAFIGPEGGLTEKEEQIIIDSGAIPVILGENILRIETAAVAFAAVLALK